MTARQPKQRADVSGASVRNPSRYRARTSPTGLRPLGAPYAQLGDAEKQVWRELARDLPWLRASDRISVELTCRLTVRLRTGELGIAGVRTLSALLSKLGASPSDVSKVGLPPDDREDPDEKFFRVN